MNNKDLFRSRFLLILLLIAGLAATAVLIPIARAGATTVNTTDDDVAVNGNCTLREVIIAVNTDTAVDACPAGNGADSIILPAGDYRFTLGGYEDVASGRTTSLFNTTITNNTADSDSDIIGEGGGIYFDRFTPCWLAARLSMPAIRPAAWTKTMLC